MARTLLTSREIGNVQRNDLDITTSGEAVIRKIVAGTHVTLSSTGVDEGTGDVTINVTGGLTIGADVTSGTSGSVLFVNTSGDLAQDNPSFAYDGTSHILKLGASGYIGNTSGTSATTGWSASQRFLQIGFDTAHNNNTQPVYAAQFDMKRSQTGGSGQQTSGLRPRAWIQDTGSSGGGIATSVEAFVENKGSTVSTNLQAIEGIVGQEAISQWTCGGWFSVNNSANSTFEDWAIRSNLSRDAGSTPKAVLYQGVLATANTGTITDAYGIRFSGWSGSGITNSYGIYMDTSIDRGSTLKYAIYSLSTSPSVFSGTVQVPNHVYGSDWDGNNTVATKNAIYDKIESLSTGGGTPGGSDTQIQFNDGGAFGGDAGLVYNKTSNILTITSGGISVPGSGSHSEQFGVSSSATGEASTAVGKLAQATANDTTSVGYDAQATTEGGVAIGKGARSTNQYGNGVAIGKGATVGTGSTETPTAIGSYASATGQKAIALGSGATSSGNSSFAMGYASVASGTSAIAIGYGSSATTGEQNISIGTGATVAGNTAIGIGSSVVSSGDRSIAIGDGANVSHGASIALGRAATSTDVNQLVIGSTTSPITEIRQVYSGFNYAKTTISSTGSVTFDLVGTSPEYTFSDPVNVPDDAYDATTWNGNTEVPTKNAIRDKIETLSAGGITRTVINTSGSATMGSTANTDYIYVVTGAHNLTLPSATGNTNRYTVKNNHSASVSVLGTIDGGTNITISPQSSVDLISDGTSWYVI